MKHLTLLLSSLVCLILESFLFQLCHVRQLRFSYFKQRSQCEYCRQLIRWYDLIPVASFLLLKGKCRYCHAQLSILYLAGEVLACIPVVLLCNHVVLLPQSLFTALYLLLLAAALYDIQTQTIPLHYLLITFITALTLAPHIYVFNLFIVGLLHLLFFVSRYAIGYGDIFLFSIISLTIPYLFFLFLFCITFIIGGCFILICLWCKKRILHIPLIPFIFLSFVSTSVFYADLLYFFNFN
ncbi:A24 family peptidase [Staphylococcus simulans]|uniref:prepilin peptidase n=1 Tax=Staphylococcus simulans TaxID=1286 RepID=UPI000D03D2BD